MFFNAPHIAEHAVFCMFAHGTRIEKNKICFFRLLREGKTHLLNKAFDLLSVRHILLAAIGMDKGKRAFAACADLHDLGCLFHGGSVIGKGLLVFLQRRVPPRLQILRANKTSCTLHCLGRANQKQR